MEILRQRLLDSTTKQSDLIEIFEAIDRGLFTFHCRAKVSHIYLSN